MTTRALLSVATFACASAKTALLVIDVQKCFIEEGSLAVPAKHIIPDINKMMDEKSCLFDDVFYSRDYHPTNHVSFASTHGLPNDIFIPGIPLMCVKPESGLTQDASCCPTEYLNPGTVNCSTDQCLPANWDYSDQNPSVIEGNTACTQCRDNPDGCFQTTQFLWPEHCLAEGDSDFPPELNMGPNPKVVKKGVNQYVDAYSSFLDNSKSVETELQDRLKAEGITNLVVVGIATDVCVRESVLDAIKKYDYTVTVVKDATAPVFGMEDPVGKANFERSVKEMEEAGATIKVVSDILAMECPAAPGTSSWTTNHWIAIIAGVIVALGVLAIVTSSSGSAPAADIEMHQGLQS